MTENSDIPTESKEGMERTRTAPEGQCCFCGEPKENHPIEAGSNSEVGNYDNHEYIDRYRGYGVDVSEFIEVECPWCDSSDAQVTAVSRGSIAISCTDCNTKFE